jgi:hypothetical protein
MYSALDIVPRPHHSQQSPRAIAIGDFRRPATTVVRSGMRSARAGMGIGMRSGVMTVVERENVEMARAVTAMKTEGECNI